MQRRFGAYLAPINKGFEKDGAFYLFSLRMVPLVPFFIVNLLMGLTSISVPAYYLASQIGMFVSTVVYVNAGAELAQITSLSGLVSPSVIVSFTLLGVVPLVAKVLIGVIQRRKRLGVFKKPKRFDANVVVVGGGSAGLVTSLIVAGAKAKVVLVESTGWEAIACIPAACRASRLSVAGASCRIFVAQPITALWTQRVKWISPRLCSVYKA